MNYEQAMQLAIELEEAVKLANRIMQDNDNLEDTLAALKPLRSAMDAYETFWGVMFS